MRTFHATPTSRSVHSVICSGCAPGEFPATPRPRLRIGYSSLRPVVTGILAARIPGNRPPRMPSMSEYQRPVTSSCGVTVNAHVSWLKLPKLKADPYGVNAKDAPIGEW
jgi:hypothetical protein